MILSSTDSLRKQVYEYLKEKIACGELRPGEMIDQKEMQERLGVSKTPLRDSLIRLEAEGVVTILPSRGVRVNRLTLREVRHIYQIGGALEAAAFEAVFPAMDPGTLGRMEAVQREVVERMGSGDYGLCPDRNIEFHELALGLCDNDALIAQIHLYRSRLYDFPRKDLISVRDWEDRYWEQHWEILRLFREGTARDLGAFIREVHWNFDAHRDVLATYYEEA